METKTIWIAVTPLLMSVLFFLVNQILGLNRYVFKRLSENGIEIQVKKFGFRFEFIKMIVEFNRLLKKEKISTKKDWIICRWVTFEIIFGYFSFIYFFVVMSFALQHP